MILSNPPGKLHRPLRTETARTRLRVGCSRRRMRPPARLWRGQRGPAGWARPLAGSVRPPHPPAGRRDYHLHGKLPLCQKLTVP
jgi:hypothetical protein